MFVTSDGDDRTAPGSRRSRRVSTPVPGRRRPGGDNHRPGGHRPRIALIGMMGSGKTTTGQHLARLLGYDFVDMDQVIEKKTGKSITAIFEREGEPMFRLRETMLLRKLSRRREIVVSTGGGIVLGAGNRRLLKESFSTVWLQVPATEIMKRIGDTCSRPLWNEVHGMQKGPRLSYLRGLARSRAPFYKAVGVPVRAAGKSPDDLARAIVRKLGILRGKNA